MWSSVRLLSSASTSPAMIDAATALSVEE
jgi:hypothetical protein